MKNTYLLYLSFTFYCLFFLSCTSDIDNTESIKDPNKSNIINLIEYAKEQYSKSLSTNKAQNEPQWSNYQILNQTNNDLVISIPIKNNSGNKYNNLIVNQNKSNNRLLLIKEPEQGFDTLPNNIRRRIICNVNGESKVCRSIVDKKGQLRYVQVRDILTTRSTINGGTLPEVVIYPGGFDYTTDWWWWDYITGLISFPPPEGYSGYTGTGSDPQQTRPDYYKASNISKDATVHNSMNTMFQNTKNDASKLHGRRERGLWVYYDAKTQKYYTGNEKVGQYVKGNVGTNYTYTYTTNL